MIDYSGIVNAAWEAATAAGDGQTENEFYELEKAHRCYVVDWRAIAIEAGLCKPEDGQPWTETEQLIAGLSDKVAWLEHEREHRLPRYTQALQEIDALRAEIGRVYDIVHPIASGPDSLISKGNTQ